MGYKQTNHPFSLVLIPYLLNQVFWGGGRLCVQILAPPLLLCKRLPYCDYDHIFPEGSNTFVWILASILLSYINSMSCCSHKEALGIPNCLGLFLENQFIGQATVSHMFLNPSLFSISA